MQGVFWYICCISNIYIKACISSVVWGEQRTELVHNSPWKEKLPFLFLMHLKQSQRRCKCNACFSLRWKCSELPPFLYSCGRQLQTLSTTPMYTFLHLSPRVAVVKCAYLEEHSLQSELLCSCCWQMCYRGLTCSFEKHLNFVLAVYI